MPMLDYVELPVGAVGAEAEFYRKAFGWEITSYGPTYAAHECDPCQLGLDGGEERVRGILPIIRTDKLEKARDAVLAAGGKLTRDIFEFPGGRRFHFTDPEGWELGVYEVARDG